MSNTKIKEIEKAEKLDRSRAPKSGKSKDINFPKFFETKTDNGITVLVIEDNRLPLVTSRFVFKTGAYLDFFNGEDKSGSASITSELLTKGTYERTATKIAEEVDYLGATLSSGCDYDATYISSYSLKKYFDNIFDIASDVILNPKFAQDEIDRVKEQRLNSLLSMIDEGDYLSEKIFRRFVYENTPYSLPVEGSKNSIENISRDDIWKFYTNTFRPENLIVAFVGDITPDEAMAKMNRRFLNWEKTTQNEQEILKSSLKNATKVYLIEKKEAVQSSLKAGHLGIERSNPDFLKVHMMNTMLGGYFTSRINKNLREVNGYTYGSSSFFNAYKYSGDFSVVTEVKNEITSNTLKEILNELNDIRNNFVTYEELQNVKNFISGSFPLQLETPNSIASKVINLKLYGLSDDYYNTYLRKINELTQDDIKDAANKYLHPDKMVISIAGNIKEIKDSMNQFGDVQVISEIN